MMNNNMKINKYINYKFNNKKLKPTQKCGGRIFQPGGGFKGN
jgi:hypothetical protein